MVDVDDEEDDDSIVALSPSTSINWTPPFAHFSQELDNSSVPILPHHLVKRDTAVSMSAEKRSATDDPGLSAVPSKAPTINAEKTAAATSTKHHHHHMEIVDGLDEPNGSDDFTTPEGQHFTTYKKTYKMYCTFDGTGKCVVNTKAGSTDVSVTINHDGNIFSYWRRLPSPCEEDFNQPNNVLGFRCTRMGFNVRRMEVVPCPGNNTTDHEVPMVPPKNTETWMTQMESFSSGSTGAVRKSLSHLTKKVLVLFLYNY